MVATLPKAPDPKESGIEPQIHKKPSWLKIRLPSGERYEQIKALRKGLGLATVCEEARCPNQAECWAGGTATFMLMGDTCTRYCRFCNVKTGNPRGLLDAAEPDKVFEAVTAMELTYVVLTMVDRDDLADGGAAHVARTIRRLRSGAPELKIEILAGDFRGNADAIAVVLDAGADVFAHNVETVRRLTPEVRDGKCDYDQTLGVLQLAHRLRPDVVTKSSIMLGLGETDVEVEETLHDLLRADVEIVTLGQYLRPAERFLPVVAYVPPEKFTHWKERAMAMGFAYCASGPLVRSSYRAGEVFLDSHIERRRSPGARSGADEPTAVSAIESV